MKKFSSPFWLIFFLFLISRIYPYFNNSIPLGYDGGIYLYLFKVFPNIPAWQIMDFSPGLYALLYPLIRSGINPELLLFPISILSQIFLFFSIFFVSKKTFGEKIALTTSFLFTVSLIQFRTFWFFYVKNTFALGILLFALYFLTKKKLMLSVFFGVSLCLFHLPTAFIYFSTLFLLLIFDRKNFAFYSKILLSTAFLGLLYYLPNVKISILPFLEPILKSIAPVQVISGTVSSSGTFYSIPTSFLMTIFYLPFAFIGFYIVRKKENMKPFLVAFILLFLMVVTQFFFSRRYFIPLDIFLIFFAGIGLNYAMKKYKNYKDIFYFYFLILIIFISAFIFKTSQPLISKSTLLEIKDFAKVNRGYVLSTSKEDNAWLLGYTNLPLIAYGYGGYDIYWSSSDWINFFGGVNSEERIKMLKKLPSPLYIFINDKTMVNFKDFKNNGCFKNISEHFYKFNCK